jgi:DNA-binding transcriptional LysR family regulator
MSLDPRLLRSFVILAEELHFGRAAQRLSIAQPALSQQIKRLELQLGVELFERSRNHVELSEAGAEMLSAARSAVESADVVDEIAASFAHGERGELRFGLSPGVHYIARTLLAELGKRMPDVHVRARQDSSGALAHGLANGELDVAIGFCAEPGDEIDLEPLVDERAVLAVAEDHPLAGRERIPLPELRGELIALVDARDGPGYNRAVVELCRGAGFEPRTVEDPSGPMAWEAVVRSGGAVGLTARCAAVSSARGVRLLDLIPERRFPVQLMRAAVERPVARAFSELAREWAQTVTPSASATLGSASDGTMSEAPSSVWSSK